MKLTQALFHKNYKFLWRRLYKTNLKTKEPNAFIPATLENKGVEVIDTYNWPPKEEFPRWMPPVANDPRYKKFVPPRDNKSHPNWHDEVRYCYTADTQLLEGLKQVLVLTKSKNFDHLPESVLKHVGKVEIPDQDHLVQRYIFQANLWNPTHEKLPKRINPMRPRYNIKAAYGIPKHLNVSILVDSLLRLCQSLGSKHPQLLTERRLTQDHFVASHFKHKADDLIDISGELKWLISSLHPLGAFVGEDAIDLTITHRLPELFPVHPTIDIPKQNIYEAEMVSGWNPGATVFLPHTMILPNLEKDWTTSQFNSRALLYCFSQALLIARTKYGISQGPLPQPIGVQCIHTDGIKFNFVCFQLNTLNLESDEGIKNMAWLDHENVMFEKVEPAFAMLRDTKYENYNSDVFKKFLAFYLNGTNIMSKS